MTATETKGSRLPQRVLCVDDNAFTLFVNVMVLRNQGYEVLASSHPLEAASIAQSEELDLAIVDYEMPEMNGAELAALCKAANPDIKVILFSGPVGVADRELAFVDRLVEKSENFDVLLAAIEELLSADRSWSSTSFNNYEHMNQ